MIAGNLARVQAELREALVAAGRAPDAAKLVAVSKTKPLQAVQEALAAGQLDFGENYAQELRDKAREITEPIRWHYIGRIQRNKAKYIAPVAFRVHALESVEQAEALLARAPDGLDALLAVHVGEEESKGGVAPARVLDTLGALAALPGLRMRGLMTIPPFREDPEDVAPFFEQMQSLLRDARDAGHDMDELSMGMTHDFKVAVRHGATWVRVGTAIFGARGT